MSHGSLDLRRSSYSQHLSSRLANHARIRRDLSSTALIQTTRFTVENELASSLPSREDMSRNSLEPGYTNSSIPNTKLSVPRCFYATSVEPVPLRSSDFRSSVADLGPFDLGDVPANTLRNMTLLNPESPSVGLRGLRSGSPLALSYLDEASRSRDSRRTDNLQRSSLRYDPTIRDSLGGPQGHYQIETCVRQNSRDTAYTSAKNLSSIRTGTETEETSHTLAAELRNPDCATASTFSSSQTQSAFSSFLRARCEGYDEWFNDFLNQFLTINDVDHVFRKHIQPSVQLLGERTTSLLLNSCHDRTQTVAALFLAESVNQITASIVSHAADRLGQVNVLTSLGTPLSRPNLSSSDERQHPRYSTESSESENLSNHIRTHFQANPHHERSSSSGAADQSPPACPDKGEKRAREESSLDKDTMSSSQIEKVGIEPKKQKRGQVSEKDSIFACHCQKRFPERFRLHNMEGTKCFGTFRSINDVKQHLRRDHIVPDYYCVQCYTVFERPNLRDDHLRSCPDEAVRLPSPFTYKMTRETARQVAAQRRVRGTFLTDEDIWFQIWDVLYRGHPRPASPYQDELWTILEAQQTAYRLADAMVRDAVGEAHRTARHMVPAAMTALLTRTFHLLGPQDSTTLLGLINACHQQRPDILTPEDTDSFVQAATQFAYSLVHPPVMSASAVASHSQIITTSEAGITTTLQEPIASLNATDATPSTDASLQLDTMTSGTSASSGIRTMLPESRGDSSLPIMIRYPEDVVDVDDEIPFIGEVASSRDDMDARPDPSYPCLPLTSSILGLFRQEPLPRPCTPDHED